MPSEQPTHHGYAVNVKDHTNYPALVGDYGELFEQEAERVYEDFQERFWADAELIAQQHGFRTVYSEGRSGGWAQPVPQPDTENMWPDDLAAWERDRFRPFERDLLFLMGETTTAAVLAIREAVQRANAELAERAH